MTTGTNQPATWSAMRWIGARLRCAAATMWTICASSVSAPTFSARITKPPVWFSVPAVTFEPGAFATGIGSPVTIDSSTVPLALDQFAVDRHLLARAHAQQLADLDGCRSATVSSRAVGLHPHGGLRREVEQRPDRARRLLAGTQLEHLAEQHQHGDHRGRLEVDRHRAVVRPRTPPETGSGAKVPTML